MKIVLGQEPNLIRESVRRIFMENAHAGFVDPQTGEVELADAINCVYDMLEIQLNSEKNPAMQLLSAIADAVEIKTQIEQINEKTAKGV